VKILNKYDFQNSIDRQISHRKKEIAMLRLLSLNSDPNYEKGIINRLIIPQVYSHYEGFIKNTSILYLRYIISKYDSTKPIADNIFALQMRKKIIKSSKSNKSSVHVNLIKDIRTNPVTLNFKPTVIVDTHSNLKSEYLKEIMFMCGIQFDAYWQSKSFFIDNLLLKNRNLITHGEMIDIDDTTASQCVSGVLEIIEKYKFELERIL
jgi:hypothetical protein